MQILEEGCHFRSKQQVWTGQTTSTGRIAKESSTPLQQTPPVPATCAVFVSNRNVDGEVCYLITSALNARALNIADERLTRAPRGEY